MKSGFASIGAVLSAVLASLCCIGPAVLAIAGVGGAGFLSVFEEYRTNLVGLTVFLLGAGFFFAYRKKEVRCEDGSCEVQSAGKWNKISLWAAMGLVAVFLTYPYLSNSFSAGPQDRDRIGFQNADLEEVVISVQGMTCTACNRHVETVVSEVAGVAGVKADFQTGEAVVQFDKGKTNADEIVKAINEKTAYRATAPLEIE